MRPLIDIIHVDFGTGEWAHNGDLLRCPDVLDTLNPTVQSQYSASTAIRWLCQYDRQFLCTLDERCLFYTWEFNPKAAIGFGLDVWGRIVGITRDYDEISGEWFGFRGSQLKGFNQAPLWSGDPAYTQKTMDDQAYRALIFLKAAANISTADAAALNLLLQRALPGKELFVLDLGRMMIRLVVREEIPIFWQSIFERYGLFAKGAGVGVELIYLPGTFFGFAGSDGLGFDQAPMWDGEVVKFEE